MDQELRAYLEGMEARMEERFARVDQRFEKVDQRFEQVDQRFEKVDQRFEGLETEVRHTRILVEGLSSDLRVLGEGVMGVSERLDEYKAETARGFNEIKAMLSPYYRNLDGRTQSLESDVRCLDSRLKVLEGRAERQTEDVLVAIRKKYGKPQS